MRAKAERTGQGIIKLAMRIIVALYIMILLQVQVPAVCGQEPQSQPRACCAGMDFLLGQWEASGAGEIGSSSGVMTFTQDLSGRVIVRRNESRSKQGSHQDLMIIYRDSAGALRADFFDSEGHVIAYEVTVTETPPTAVFTHASTDKEPGFRFSHISTDDGSLDLVFEIARPGSSVFKPYLKGVARRSR
jgi:hypothetical protein